jgi:hypothetical protein
MDSEYSIDRQFQPNEKHSELGIAGFVLSILNGLGTLLCFGAPAILHFTNQPISNGLGLLFGLSFFAVILLSFVGVVVSMIGIIQPRRKKVLPIIGLVLNSIVLLGLATLIVPQLIKALS